MKKLDWSQFIDFWKQFYDDRKHPDNEFYFPYINDLSKENFLEKLWQWKMGVHYKNSNSQRVLKLMRKEKVTIRDYRKSQSTFEELWRFTGNIFRTGIIYKVFLVHICKPDDYPILDQNAFRAYTFITTGKLVKEPKNLEDYQNYRRFVLKIHQRCKISLRDIDRGLMTFGQFLSNPQRKVK